LYINGVLVIGICLAYLGVMIKLGSQGR